jgi:flagellar motor switch protein FliN/FliY
VAADLGLILEVPLRLSVEIGSANLPVRDVLALTKGSVVELDRMSGEPADVYANDRLIARGEVSVADQRVAIRITELVGPKARS